MNFGSDFSLQTQAGGKGGVKMHNEEAEILDRQNQQQINEVREYRNHPHQSFQIILPRHC